MPSSNQRPRVGRAARIVLLPINGKFIDATIPRSLKDLFKPNTIHSGIKASTLCFCETAFQWESGYDIHTIQELLGHSDVSTTMLYTHVANKGDLDVRSHADLL